MAYARSQDLDDLLFGVRRSVRYHMRRQRYFDRVNDFGMIVTFLAGGSTLATVLALGHVFQIIAATLTAIVSASHVIFSPARRARDYNAIAQSFVGLEQDIIRAGSDPTDDQLVTLSLKRLEIEAQEPPINRVLDIICHNELCTAIGTHDQRVNVTMVQRWLANFGIDFRADRITPPQPASTI